MLLDSWRINQRSVKVRVVRYFSPAHDAELDPSQQPVKYTKTYDFIVLHRLITMIKKRCHLSHAFSVFVSHLC